MNEIEKMYKIAGEDMFARWGLTLIIRRLLKIMIEEKQDTEETLDD